MGTPKKKLCWNCEARVTLTEEYCPCCGVYLSPSTVPEGSHLNHLAPPYKIVEEEEKETPNSPYSNDESNPKENGLLEDAESHSEFQNLCILISCLLSGVVFLLFGLALFLFSHKGYFTLQWNAAYWYLYLLFSLPLLVIGWNKLQSLPE